MFGKRIEYEQPEDQQKRYEGLVERRQRTYEFFWELRETFGIRLFGGLAETALEQLRNTRFEDIGSRRRFLKVAGSIRIPMPKIPAFLHSSH